MEQQNMATREDNGGGKYERRQYHIPIKKEANNTGRKKIIISN